MNKLILSSLIFVSCVFAEDFNKTAALEHLDEIIAHKKLVISEAAQWNEKHGPTLEALNKIVQIITPNIDPNDKDFVKLGKRQEDMKDALEELVKLAGISDFKGTTQAPDLEAIAEASKVENILDLKKFLSSQKNRLIPGTKSRHLTKAVARYFDEAVALIDLLEERAAVARKESEDGLDPFSRQLEKRKSEYKAIGNLYPRIDAAAENDPSTFYVPNQKFAIDSFETILKSAQDAYQAVNSCPSTEEIETAIAQKKLALAENSNKMAARRLKHDEEKAKLKMNHEQSLKETIKGFVEKRFVLSATITGEGESDIKVESNKVITASSLTPEEAVKELQLALVTDALRKDHETNFTKMVEAITEAKNKENESISDIEILSNLPLTGELAKAFSNAKVTFEKGFDENSIQDFVKEVSEEKQSQENNLLYQETRSDKAYQSDIAGLALEEKNIKGQLATLNTCMADAKALLETVSGVDTQTSDFSNITNQAHDLKKRSQDLIKK